MLKPCNWHMHLQTVLIGYAHPPICFLSYC